MHNARTENYITEVVVSHSFYIILYETIGIRVPSHDIYT